jgi:hypothetical protein
MSIRDASVQLIFTDPPYLEKDVPLYGDLAAFAARVLVPGGLCLAYAGNSFLPEIYRLMSGHLEYVWTFAITHSGGNLRFHKWHLYNGWKPILCFGKPPVACWWDWFRDVATGTREKGTHKWQQSVVEARHFIAALSTDGGLVVDPFCGGGTTCVAATELGRPFAAFEIEEKSFNKANRRIAAAFARARGEVVADEEDEEDDDDSEPGSVYHDLARFAELHDELSPRWKTKDEISLAYEQFKQYAYLLKKAMEESDG